MRFIPTRFHAPLDYIVGAVLIAAPWIFGFSDIGVAAAVSIVLGAGLIAYSLVTDYELGVWRVAPMAVHNLIDVVAGALLAASPWLFGYADEGASVWLPFVVIGVAAVFLGLTTKQAGGYRYGQPGPPGREHRRELNGPRRDGLGGRLSELGPGSGARDPGPGTTSSRGCPRAGAAARDQGGAAGEQAERADDQRDDRQGVAA
jgi:hypothetical protein